MRSHPVEIVRNESEGSWLDWRVDAGLGASELAAALGRNEWEVPFVVWAKKVRQTRDLPTPKSAEGHRLERAILDWYADVRDVRVARPEGGFCSWRWPDAMLFGTPDGIVVDGPPGVFEVATPADVAAMALDGGVDAKRAGERMAPSWGPSGSRKLPEPYWLQAQVYGGFFNVPWWDIACNIDGALRIYRIPIEAEVVDYLRRECRRWWDHHVVGGVAPDITASATMTALAHRKIKNAIGDLPAKPLEVSALDLGVAARLSMVHHAQKALRDARTVLELQLTNSMARNDATSLVIPGGGARGGDAVVAQIKPSSKRSTIDRDAIIAALEARLCEHEDAAAVAAFLDGLREQHTYASDTSASFDFKPKGDLTKMAKLLSAARGRVHGGFPSADDIEGAETLNLGEGGGSVARRLFNTTTESDDDK